MKRELRKLDLNIKSYLLSNAGEKEENCRAKRISKLVEAWERQKKDIATPLREFTNLELEKSHPGC